MDLAHLAQAHQDSQRLLELAQELGNSLNLPETLSVIGAQFRDVIPYDTIGVFQLQGDSLTPLFAFGESSRALLGIGNGSQQSLSAQVAQSGEPVLNADPRRDIAFSPLRSALVVPLAGNGGLRGALSLYRTQESGFTDQDLALAMKFSRKIATAIENALAFQSVVQNSNNDALTGLPNARALFLQLDGETARGRRTGAFLALLTCDVFAFRRINERYGKTRADLLLLEIAKLLKQHCREYDTIARTGSDEFALLLPEFPHDAFENKRHGVAAVAREAGRTVLGEDFVEFAVGWASFPEDGMDADSLLAKADARLFEAKQRQRATVHSWLFVDK
ncbi:MAG: sensor domain-containing diguanylate cyclase [Bryobacteraceae bacterium]